MAVRVVVLEKKFPNAECGLKSRELKQRVASKLVSTVKKLKYRVMVSGMEASRFFRIR
jgi:methionine synthase II (cobalamin-independent)